MAGSLLGTAATWLFLTWPAPLSAPSRLGVIVALTGAGGSLGGMAAALCALYRVTVAYGLLLGACVVVWLGAVRLLVVGSIGSFSISRSSVWLVLLVTAIVEMVVVNLDPPEKRSKDRGG